MLWLNQDDPESTRKEQLLQYSLEDTREDLWESIEVPSRKFCRWQCITFGINLGLTTIVLNILSFFNMIAIYQLPTSASASLGGYPIDFPKKLMKIFPIFFPRGVSKLHLFSNLGNILIQLQCFPWYISFSHSNEFINRQIVILLNCGILLIRFLSTLSGINWITTLGLEPLHPNVMGWGGLSVIAMTVLISVLSGLFAYWTCCCCHQLQEPFDEMMSEAGMRGNIADQLGFIQIFKVSFKFWIGCPLLLSMIFVQIS